MSFLVKKTKIIFDSLLLIFKAKKINIVTVSSYATQLGFLTTYKYQNNLKDINSKSESKTIYIFLFFPIRSDTKIKNICNFKEILGKQEYINFKVDSLIKRLLIYPIFNLIYFTKNKNNIFLWQTRYRWINDLYGSAYFNFYLPIPEFKIILFGDGFLNLMPINKPSWLIKNQIDHAKYIKTKNLFKSYHHFEIYNHKYKYKSELINSEFINDFLNQYISKEYDYDLTKSLSNLDIFLKGFVKKEKKIFIFPTTTFYETKRCTLDNEVNMYFDYLTKKENLRFSFLLIKPHPGSTKIKNIKLFKKLEKNYQNKKIFVLNPYLFDKDISLSNIPLEVIVTYLLNFLEVKNIILACCSTASLSVKTLNPDIKLEFAFGKALLEKYVRLSYVNQRLDQEKMIKNAIRSIRL